MCAREAFTLYGRGQGTVSGDDLFTALRCCSVNPTLAAVKSITQGADEVDLEAFMTVVATTKTTGSGKDTVTKAFQAMDRTKTGSVSAAELTAILSNSGEKLTGAEIKAAIGKYGGGDVPYEQLVNDIFASVPVIAKAAGGSRTAAAPVKRAAPKAKAAAPKAKPAPAKAAAPPADDFGGGFGDDDDNDEFGF